MKKKNLFLLSGVFLLAFTLFICVLSAVNPACASGPSKTPDHVTLTWTQDPATTQTITWRTDTTVNQGMVQISLNQDDFNLPNPMSARTVQAEAYTLSTERGDMNIFSATVAGLTPGLTYYYRVGDGQNWSGVSSFTTEKKSGVEEYRFLIFGDSQSGDAYNPDYGPWKNTLQNAFNANPDVKFFINVGDLVETGQRYAHWNNWFSAAEGVINRIPAMPVLGNHETYNRYGSSGKPAYFLAQFKLPQNGPDGLKGQVYSYDYGNVHFAVLDSQVEEEGNILEPQKEWLENDLKNSDKKWKLVFFHKSPYSHKSTQTKKILRKAFAPILDKYHADVVFNGHDHCLARTFPIYGDKQVDSPSKGTVYYTVGRSGGYSSNGFKKKVWDEFFYAPRDQPNYLVAEVSENRLTIKAVKQDGTLIDTYTIDKIPGQDSTRAVLPTIMQFFHCIEEYGVKVIRSCLNR